MLTRLVKRYKIDSGKKSRKMLTRLVKGYKIKAEKKSREMLTRLVKRYTIDSGKKSRKGTASEFLGSLLSDDVLSGLPKSNSFACEGFNINRTKSCPMNGGKLNGITK
jgi:hypothetical protein